MIAQGINVLSDLNPGEKCNPFKFVYSVVNRLTEKKPTQLMKKISNLSPQSKYPKHPKLYVHNFSNFFIESNITGSLIFRS